MHPMSLRPLASAGGCAAVLGALILLLTACPATGPEPAPEPGTPSYQEAAEAAYESGRTALDRRDYAIALERFEQVRRRYPYSEFAALADLRIADALFAQDKFLEAADAYRTFVRLRPAHPEADYAAFREGLALMRKAPSDMWILPPSHEKDLTHVQEVIGTVRRFLHEYPESEYVDEARELIAEAEGRLARHELYVADFYRRRGQWQAVVFRLEALLDRYPGVGFDEEAKVGLAEAYLELEEPRLRDALRLADEVLAAEDVDEGVASRARRVRARVPGASDGPAEPGAAAAHEPAEAVVRAK
jgi:outer membrane protein assembly factor BamD